MADIKMDEIDFYNLLSSVKDYITNVNEHQMPVSLKERGNAILLNIEVEYQKRELMIERKRYYDFWKDNQDSNPKEAKEAYQGYLRAKEKLDLLKKK